MLDRIGPLNLLKGTDYSAVVKYPFFKYTWRLNYLLLLHPQAMFTKVQNTLLKDNASSSKKVIILVWITFGTSGHDGVIVSKLSNIKGLRCWEASCYHIVACELLSRWCSMYDEAYCLVMSTSFLHCLNITHNAIPGFTKHWNKLQSSIQIEQPEQFSLSLIEWSLCAHRKYFTILHC